MDKQLREAISGKMIHYQQPFFGVSEKDTEESLRERISQLYDHGIFSMVLEYGKTSGSVFEAPKFDDDWWERLGYITKICKELGMTFWIQDAVPFPTGSANGSFQEEKNKFKSKKFIIERHTDIKGPIQDVYLSVNKLMNAIQGNVLEAVKNVSEVPNRFLYAAALRHSEDGGGYESASAIDLTDKVVNGVLRADFGSGVWRLFIAAETYSGGRRHFMNLLDEESVRVQIDSVHTPHYERLKKEIGKTWRGFFYDEPELGNLEGYVFDCLPGKSYHGMNIPLPWSKYLPFLLEKRLGSKLAELLPCLWYDCGDTTYIVRHAYMDILTELVAKHYNGQVYQWCEERGIAYIGHVLEDENSHTRLGCGAGNFFRVQEGQHMAGIDVVGNQIWPGLDFKGMSWYGAIDGDGEFYHYGLAKLGASAGHIDPKKLGRSVCEFLAVYGKVSGTRIRKFIIDHLLVNGINNLIPADAGLYNNARFSRKLNEYTDRMCHILNFGEHVAPVAVLYHADAEWSGEFQYFHKPAKELATHQIDYDVIPKDVFIHKEYYGTRLEKGKLIVNKEKYSALVIPYSQRIPKEVADLIQDAEKARFPVYFVDKHPEGFCENTKKLPQEIYSCRVIPLNRLAEGLRKDQIFEISTSNDQHYLRYLHYRRGNLELYLFHNEEPVDEIDTVVSVPTIKPVRVYDVMENRISIPDVRLKKGITEIPLRLGQYESKLFLFGKELEALSAVEISDAMADLSSKTTDLNSTMPDLKIGVADRSGGKELHANWSISFESLDSTPSPKSFSSEKLFDIGAIGRFPNFYGKIIYRTKFTVGAQLPRMLSLGRVSECAELSVNNEYLGAAVAEPYSFVLGSAVKKGINELKVVVTSNISRSMDTDISNGLSIFGALEASTYCSLEPAGLLGPIRLI